MIYARRREGPKAFLEFFVQHVDGFLTLPKSNLERFSKRLLQAPVPIGPYILMPVDSKASGPVRRPLKNIAEDGAWITHADTIARGSYGHLIGKSVYYGVPIDPKLEHSLNESALYKAVEKLWPDCLLKNEPYVMYHGTARPLVKNILKEGLKPTFVMLGNGIYLGSFWKAFRFAVFTQAYEKRLGAILRVYCFPTKTPLIKTTSSDRCRCDDCSRSKDLGILCDHLSLWQKVTDMVIAWPSPGSPIKNEECAVPDASCLLIDSVGHVTCMTEHHEPLNRTISIE
jgi:hypothetical protein